MHIEKTSSNQGHTLNLLLSKQGLIREMPFQPGTDPIPTNRGPYMLLNAMLVNRGPTKSY